MIFDELKPKKNVLLSEMNDNDLNHRKNRLISDNGKNIVPPFDTRRANHGYEKH